MAIAETQFKFIGLDPTGDLGGITYYTTRKRKTVGYDKSPPLKPATSRQLVRRNRWRAAARQWQLLDQSQRDQWHEAARRAKLRVHGYNLYVFFFTTQKWSYADAITKASGIDVRTI